MLAQPMTKESRWHRQDRPVIISSEIITPTKPLPTMYDLPSEDPEEPGVPDQFHTSQPNLLSETFFPPEHAADQIMIGCDLNLYYDIDNHGNYKRPDWYAVLGVDNSEMRLSYVMWIEQVAPAIIVELLSPGTEDEDLGRTHRKDNRPPTKWDVYETYLAVPYYVVFSRYTNELRGFELIDQTYVEMIPVDNRLWFKKLQLGLGLWNGTWDGYKRLWLRWYNIGNNWIPTRTEKAEQEKKKAVQADLRAEQEKKKAVQAVLRAEQEKKKTVQADLRAEQERKKVEQLVAKLKSFGIAV